MNERINKYYDFERTAGSVRSGEHRRLVGGFWDEVGQLQLDYVKNRGLTPEMRVLDVGCGCLRGGVQFVRYLAPGNYHGIDISQELLDVGYNVELAKLGIQHKLPRGNLACNEQFDAKSFNVTFDVAMAQSLFTHLPLNHIRLCLTQLADVVCVDGVLYATIYSSPEDHDWRRPLRHSRGGVTSYPASDPYHYRTEDISYCASGLPWRLELMDDWSHPRSQSMMMFTRTE